LRLTLGVDQHHIGRDVGPRWIDRLADGGLEPIKGARAGAIAAEAAKAVVVSGRVVGKLGTCVARQPKTVPKEAAEKSCLQQYEDCVKKDGNRPEGDKVNDRCVEVINKNISPK
jgi:hypothetical protein